MAGWNERKLDELFEAYRESLPDREPSTNFTPELWRRIEQKRQLTFCMPRFARVFVSGALAMCFAMTFLTWTPPSSKPVYTATYADVLDEETTHDIDVGEAL